MTEFFSNPTHSAAAAVIIGMPGSGKSRLARELCKFDEANALNMVDTDQKIKEKFGLEIPQIFETHGEERFRQVEAEVIENHIWQSGVILSTGGGAPMTPRVQELIEEYKAQGGIVIYIDVLDDVAIERVERKSDRPLINEGEESAADKWKTLKALRESTYQRLANFTIASGSVDSEIIAGQLFDLLDTSKVKRVDIDYPIFIGADILPAVPVFIPKNTQKILIIHQPTVSGYASNLVNYIRRYNPALDVTLHPIPDAEKGKRLKVVSKAWEALGEKAFGREDLIIGLGGGAATDLAGFVASTWQRGIKYINIPTSLLAQVDASVGGKTGINCEAGKNMIGSFYSPIAVFADTSTLKTLTERDFIEGFGEVIKSGFIADESILNKVEANISQLRVDRDPELLRELINRSVKVKANLVRSDFRESGDRIFLNYGHTLAHAIESVENYKLRHGEAVAIGMVYAALIAYKLKLIDQKTVQFHRDLLGAIGLPNHYANHRANHFDGAKFRGASFDQVYAIMKQDKKQVASKIRFVLLKGIEEPVVAPEPEFEILEAAYNEL